MKLTDDEYMQFAIDAAIAAGLRDEVPIGACVVDGAGNVISTAGNNTISANDPTGHAEILAIRLAAKKVDNYRLTECILYTTIEPCVMCAGAIVNARIAKLVFGALDERYGAVRTRFDLCDNPALNHRLEIEFGILEDECRGMVQSFFRKKRK